MPSENIILRWVVQVRPAVPPYYWSGQVYQQIAGNEDVMTTMCRPSLNSQIVRASFVDVSVDSTV